MSLVTVSELFKHVPVHLKRFHNLWLVWEQFCQSEVNYTNIVYSKVNLSEVLKVFLEVSR